MRNPEISKFVPDHLKTTKMCKDPVKRLPYLIRYVPDQYKTRKMYEKAILESGGTLKSFPDCCKLLYCFIFNCFITHFLIFVAFRNRL